MKKMIVIILLAILVIFLSIAIYTEWAPWEPGWLCGPGHFFEGRTAIIVDIIFWGILISWYYLITCLRKSIEKM